MKMGWLSLVKTMIKMEKVWSNLTDSSPLNARCIDRDSQVGVCVLPAFIWRNQKSPSEYSSPQGHGGSLSC